MSTRVPDAWDDIEPVEQDDGVDYSKSKGSKVNNSVPDNWDDDENEEELDSQQNISGPTVKDIPTESTLDGTGENKPSSAKSYAAATSENVVTSKLKSAPIVKSYSVQTSSFPPEMSFEPSIRIMKRPQQASRQNSGSQLPNNERQTIQEREEKYKLARERIFGSSTSSSDSLKLIDSPKRGSTPAKFRSGSSQESEAHTYSKPNANEEQIRLMREPLGPDSRPAFKRKPPGKVVIAEQQTEPIN